jgi:uncharacterized protein (TIGR02246 family)
MRLLVAAILLTAATSSSRAQGSAAANQEIRKQLAVVQSTFNKQDVAGLVAVYAPDGDVMINDGPYRAGTAGLMKGTRDDFAANPKGLQISLTVTDVRFVSADVAVASTRAHFNLPEVPDDRGTWIFVHRDGKWMVASLRVQAAQRK